MVYFQNLLAEVDYTPIRAYEVKKGVFRREPGGEKVECFSYRLKKNENANPVSWQEVRQLSFALEDGREEKIREFFSRYGPIAPDIEGIEPVEKLKEYLFFFRELTNWVTWLKEGRLPPLRERIEEGQRILDRTTFQTFRRVRYIPEKTVEAPSDIHLEDGRRIIRLSATATAHFFGEAYAIVIPSEKRLPSFAWQEVAQATARYLETIPLIPEVKSGVILFRFKARGALDAAFLQWYFEEFISYKTCAAEECEAPVFRINAKYCSERCRNREKKRRYRERKRRSRIRCR